MEKLSDKIWGGVLSGGMFMKVAVLARTEKDVAYIKYLLSQGQEIAFCDDPLQADAVIVDTELLTPAEKEVLKALADYGSIEEVAAKTFRAKATVKKHLCSARKKLKAKTNIQAIAFALRYRLIH
jgi:DNA-binding NarL/FixJ family response regulator